MDVSGADILRRKRRFTVVLAVALSFVAASIYQYVISSRTPHLTASVGQAQLEKTGPAMDALGKLAIKGRAPKTGYSRDKFSSGWANVDGCDLRERILRRDMLEVRLKDDKCTVLSGKLDDPYTSQVIAFTRGPGTSTKVQIDHVVAVGDAWQKGAQQLDAEKRHSFYNDPLNLLAVDGPTNQKKSDGDAATWLPPNKSYRCRYVARQIAVKAKYVLWVTQAEYDAMKRVLNTCPGQLLPVVG